MKEHSQQNEAFVAFHEKLKAQNKTREEIIQSCITHFNLGGSNPRHSYRAWLSRLADPTKYGGRFTARVKVFQLTRNNKTKPVEAATVAADSLIEVDLPVVETVTETVETANES